MSLPDRNNPYAFDDFLAWRKSVDYYLDDPFLQKVVKHYTGEAWEAVDAAARDISPHASFRWRDFSETIAWPEKRPYMMHYDGHNHRIDRIVRPAETLALEKEVFGQALFSIHTPPWVKLVKMYLTYQNGEAGVCCPVTCTEGLVELLRALADTPETRAVLAHCAEGIDGNFAIGAQYLSEIQGGSDVPANLLEAVEEQGGWRLYGQKFFCSATHADYAVVTAKPAGSEKVGLFVIPSWLPGDKEKEIRNGYTIDRIKWKMGTAELPTAEITFNGAVAYPVGPLDRGLANVVSIVLTYSRLTVGLSAAAAMARCAREAEKYASFRTAFGLTIDHFPMLAGQVEEIVHYARRATAGTFKLYRDFLHHKDRLNQRLDGSGELEEQKHCFNVRELIMLQKIATTRDAMAVCQKAMSVFGGHGVMEDFSALPRLFRDAAINEQWEGPRNVLLTQMHRDFQKVSPWYPADQVVRRMLAGGEGQVVDELAEEIKRLVAHPTLFQMDEATKEICVCWDDYCHRLFHAYQDLALSEVVLGN